MKTAKRTLKNALLYLFLVWSGSQTVLGQEVYSIDSFDLERDIGAWYNAQMGSAGSSLKIVGTFMPISTAFRTSSPFYPSLNWVASDLSYRGQVFKNVELIYDVHKDILFIKHPQRLTPLKIHQEQVDWFNIDGHYFKRVEGQNGFYEVLYEGTSLKLLKKSTKRLVIKKDPFYSNQERYFVVMNGETNRVNKRSSFEKLFPSRKREIKQYVKENLRSVFRKDMDASMLQLTQLCDGHFFP